MIKLNIINPPPYHEVKITSKFLPSFDNEWISLRLLYYNNFVCNLQNVVNKWCVQNWQWLVYFLYLLTRQWMIKSSIKKLWKIVQS